MRSLRPELKIWLKTQRLPVIIGILAGLASLILLQRERERWQAAAGSGPQKRVLILEREVKPGQRLEAKWLQAASMPTRYVHPMALDSGDKELVGGARAAHTLIAGQYLLWSDVQPASDDAAAAGLVRPNERAISLNVNEVSGVGRLIRNNDHIDIFGTFDRNEGVVTVPILQNVVVIATGQNMHRAGGGDYSTLSVSVSPQEAALLTLAQANGRLTYVLRNNFDWETIPDLQRVSLDDLFEDGRRQAMQEKHNIRVVKGKQ